MNTKETKRRRKEAQMGRQLFLGFLGFITIFYGVIITYHLLVPQGSVAESGGLSASLLEECRELCLAYGLVPTGHIANDAKAYLRAEKPQPIDEPIHKILTDAEFVPRESQAHELIGHIAPDFELPNDRDERVSLKTTLESGPVVLVFYYGYHCNHCVGQLFGLNEDLQRFAELGTRVIAISGDPVELTAKRFAEYGRFDFPVLSDKDNLVAERYGVFQPESDGKPEKLVHGTFVIDAKGVVVWANTGNKPFLDNRTLLTVIAGKHGLIAPKEVSQSEAKTTTLK